MYSYIKKGAVLLAILAAVGCGSSNDSSSNSSSSISLGARPYYLVSKVTNSSLQSELKQCEDKTMKRTTFSIAHRGAPLQYPEHSKEGYEAAARMGAGVIECDVTFTKDKELVCRHSQCDLHTTTDILLHDNLSSKCTVPPTIVDGKLTNASDIKCCTSDITLAEFKTLHAKMDAGNSSATTIAEYMDATPDFRTDLYSQNATLMTHKESIELFKSLGVKMTPELKSPSVDMPFDGMTQKQYAQKMIDEYIEAGVKPSDVFAQSFNYDDILYWITNVPEFGKQATYLDDRYSSAKNGGVEFDTMNDTTWTKSMESIKADGVNIIAPPLYFLVTLENGKIVPSLYAKKAKSAGLNIIPWSLERSGPLTKGGGWYYNSITQATTNEGVVYELLDVLGRDIGVLGVFSDWPATTTYYGNCFGL